MRIIRPRRTSLRIISISDPWLFLIINAMIKKSVNIELIAINIHSPLITIY